MQILQDRVAIVTGGGRGIGEAVARLFAREGGRVVVNDLGCERDGSGSDPQLAERVAREIVADGGAAVANTESVASSSGARSIVECALDEFGGLDVLVNCAGLLRSRRLLEMTPEQWDAVTEVRLRGTFLCTQAAAQRMVEHAEGWVVNIVSRAGLLGDLDQANCAAADAGVYGLTRSAAIELQRHRIAVNAVAPLARTRLTEELPALTEMETLTTEHVAPVILFLSSRLSGGLTGHVLAVSGARVSVYKLVESRGVFKQSERGVWRAEEIAEHWEAISKI
jgi:NAD(P)-dependent dehydrogenase (short-subunit alcohol dehydrogenase family)